MRQLSSVAGPSSHTAFFRTLEFGFAPARFSAAMSARFGRSFRLSVGDNHALFTADPAHIRRIFSADANTFHTFAALSLRNIFGPQSVLLTSGPTHTRQRKLLAPPINGARLRAFGESMQAIAEEHVGKLKAGEVFRASDLTTAFTLDVIVRVVFGAESGEQARELKVLLTELVETLPPLALFVPRLQHPAFPPWARYARLRERAQHWMRGYIQQRRRELRRQDVLSLMLETRYDDGSEMADDEIRDQLVTLLLAGHETTALTLASCLSRLHRTPGVLPRLMRELASADGIEQLQRLPYLSAVIDETLRIDPIVTDVARVPVAPYALEDDLVIQPREVLFVLIEAVHRDPEFYPEPSAFRPERFLDKPPSPFTFLPFGGGVRRCLGAAFSDYESKIFLATLLRRAELALVHKAPDRRVRRNITMGPERGVPMRVIGLR